MNKKYILGFLIVLLAFNTILSNELENIAILNSSSVFLIDTLKTYSWFNNNKFGDYPLFTKYLYNEKLLNSEIIKFSWDSTENKPIYKNRTQLFYNENNLISEVINQKYKETGVFKEWIGIDKYDYLYDTTGRMVEEIYTKYDKYTMDWGFIYKYLYYYNDDDKIKESWREVWNSELSVWKKDIRHLYFLNEYNEPTLCNYSYPNEDSTDWFPTIYPLSKYDNWYNENGNKTLEIVYYYHRKSGIFQKTDSILYFYDNNFNLIEKIHINSNTYYDSVWALQNHRFYQYDTDNNIIVDTLSSFSPQSHFSEKKEYIYLKTTDIKENKNTNSSENLKIIPNPAQDFINIVMNLTISSNVQLYIYDISLHYKKLIHNNYYNAGIHSIIYNSSDLPSGNYLLELQTNENFIIKQLLIIK